jgi:predicted Zn-dependent protease
MQNFKNVRMKSAYPKIFFNILLLLAIPEAMKAQSDAAFREYNKTFTTYPFSNPNPDPNPLSLIYPYFRYDGFTDKAIQKDWKVVELENDFIRILILPQVGGKIWTAIDKKNNKPFIYDNDAVKFRDIAMRGPWTSGGLEANFGIIGHTPGVATPVNYLTKKNEDGSVSCVISLLDLLTDTRWNMEINLPKDKAFFITRFLWQNSTPLPQPYYTWMNLGEKVSDSLEYIFPGNKYIYHDGKVYDFPINPNNHKNISIYNQNDFGGPKSYHVTGAHSKYFGVLWQKENFGMIHYAEREAKIGKKIWIWGLSRQGMIWEKLLTDNSGQYTEIQSGRLYNQNAAESLFSPFKQFDFAPYNTDSWSEYWYPFQNTDGVAKADLNGVFNIKKQDGKEVIFISPVSYINDTLKAWNNAGKIILEKFVNLAPLESFQQDIALENGESIARISLAGTVINKNDSTEKILDRPLTPFKEFDWNTAYGFYLKGKYLSDTRHYDSAEANIRKSLLKEPGFVPALDEMAFLQYRKMNYDSAWHFASLALSVNTYDPAANYCYGLASLKLNKIYDAEDGFEVAAITPEYRSAAYTELSKIKLRQKNYALSFEYATKSLVNNSENISAMQLQYVCARLMNNKQEQEKIKDEILRLDPMNHFIRFEEFWQNRNAVNQQKFNFLIRDELPQQTYLNLAVWYSNLGLQEESEAVLESCPEKNDEIFYWLAWLNRDNASGNQYLNQAANGDAYLIFSFRAESAVVMRWAMNNSKPTDWKCRYFLAMIQAFHGHQDKALELLQNESAPQNFAPYYVLRSRLRSDSDTQSVQSDLTRAMAIDKNDWRYGKYLTDFLLTQKKFKEALQTIAPYYKKDNDNYMAGLLYARCLLLNRDYLSAEKILDHIHVLPYEGANEAHRLYVQTKLNLALEFLQKHKYKTALQKISDARQWPERLGSGAPYPDMKNETLQDDIESLVKETQQGKKLSDNMIGEYRQKLNGERS